MKIVVVGGGPCGLASSYFIKKIHPDYEVILLEKDSILGKRIKVSGNGRCNFSNDNISVSSYHNGELINNILDEFKKQENKFFNEVNIKYYSDEEGRKYPLTNSSKTIQNALINAIKKVGVEIELETFLIDIDVNNNILYTSKGNINADKIILALGGASYFYDLSNFNFLKKYFKITDIKSSLCPIVIKEKVPKDVVGKRSKAFVSLYQNDKLIHDEIGEVIFKKDGISGIVIFNISSVISHLKNQSNIKIKLNFISGISREEINNQLNKFSKDEVVSSYVVDEISNWIISRYNDVYKGLSEFEITFKELYPLKESQVTNGGIDLSILNLSNLSSLEYKNIYFGGELIDVDGLCGGFNIHFALASGYYIAKHL